LDRQGLEEVQAVVGDAHQLPFETDSVEEVHAHQVLQHVQDPVRLLPEMRRVTSPGGLVAVRDSDYEGFRCRPETPAIDRWLALDVRAARAHGGTPCAGSRLLAWAHEAGFSTGIAGSSPSCYASVERRAAWAATCAGRLEAGPFADQLEREDWAGGAERAELAAAFRAWSEEPDAWFSLLHGEILARA